MVTEKKKLVTRRMHPILCLQITQLIKKRTLWSPCLVLPCFCFCYYYSILFYLSKRTCGHRVWFCLAFVLVIIILFYSICPREPVFTVFGFASCISFCHYYFILFFFLFLCGPLIFLFFFDVDVGLLIDSAIYFFSFLNFIF